MSKELTAFYDLAVGPVSFDVFGFLIQARMEQERIGADSLHVVIVPKTDGIGGMFRDKTALYDAHEMKWRLWNIVIPACQLASATVSLTTGWASAERLATDRVWPEDWRHQTLKKAHHHATEIIAACRAGRSLPWLSASPQALRVVGEWFASMGRPVVTLTERNTYEPLRNSNPTAWDALASQAEERGFAVVRLQDTALALRSGSGYGELNIDLRMACYQLAKMNWHANGGPCVLCWYSESPFIQLGAGFPRDPYTKHYEFLGLVAGQQLPWARADQILIYEPDSREQLLASFDRWSASNE